MANETTIDKETARRLLLILSLEGDVKREEIEWALGIIHQIPGYAGITMAKAVQDDFLREVLVAIAAEQLSSTTPKELETLIEDAKKREAALKSAKETGEKKAEEFIEAAEKAAKTKAPTPVPETAPPPPSEEPVSFGIKITPAALKAFGESAGKVTTTPFKLVGFFSPPKVLTQAPQTTAALASAMSLSQIAAKAEKLPEVERKQFLRFVENLRQAEFSFYAQVKLQRTPLSVRGMTILMGSEFGMTQGEVVALIHGGAPSGKGPSFFGRVGQQIFGGLAQKAVTKAATKAVTSALTKTGISVTTKVVSGGIGKVIGGLIGTAGGPVGTAIGLAVGWVVDKVVGPLINKVIDFISKNKWVLATPFVLAGLIFGLPWLTVGGIVLGGFLLVGGVGPALSRAGGFASSVIGGITSLAVASIATPLLIALISIPVLVAIILFIINSGAYMVPPSSSSVLEENPYIGVVKEVGPSGPFENSDLPITVTYTITVTAKRGTLTNISFEHKCEAIAENGTSPCPAPLPDTTPLEISPVEPYLYTYTQTYSGASYYDSLVINTFTVTADTPETTGTSASGAASIIIGNPPTGCYSVEGTWPASERTAIMAAVSNLVGGSPTFVVRLCAAYSQVNLYYDPSKVCGAWGCAPGGNIIYFNSGGLGSLRNATYILAHESGHVLSYGNGSLFQSYRAFPGTLSELPVCNYGGSSETEGFAEAIAHYVVHSPCLSENPNNIKFVETYIFR